MSAGAGSEGHRDVDRAEPASAPQPALSNAAGGSAAGRTPTVFIGSGAFAVPALRRLAAHPDVALVGVVTAPPRPAGRHLRLVPSAVAAAATELGIGPILTPGRLRAQDAVAAVLDLGPELIVLADYGQIVPPALLELRHGALNLHPSLLPRHRGASPIPATILAGDERTGVSLMRMDAGLDTGPLVAVERIDLAGDETTPGLEVHLAAIAADLLERSLGAWLRGDLPARPQPSEGATLTRPLRRSDGRLDPDRSIVELERQVRAYQPWPGSWFEAAGLRVLVHSAEIVPGPLRDVPGRLTASDGLALVAADGILALGEVQLAGGRRMPAADLRRGHPELIGARIDPAEPA